jgi:hypothetical protein
MKKLLQSFALGLTVATLPLFSIDDQEGELDREDIQALRDWLNTKRQVTIREIGGNLSLSGEVRAEFQCTNEVANGIAQRGPNSVGKLPTNAYDIEVNIMLDYRADRTWAAIKLEFDNDAGLFTSTSNKIRIEKAFWGVRVYDGDIASFDTEVGRRPLFTVFDSKLMFSSQSDGVLFRYDISTESRGEIYIHALAELVDDRRNQYAYLAEIGWLSIWGTNLFFKYSIADWNTKHFPNAIDKYRFDYIVNQWLMGYKFAPSVFGKLVMPYAAFVWNPSAARSVATNQEKANLGGYLGVSVGELRKAHDWAFDINYQVVEAQAVPEFDFNGIGIGNASKSGLYTTTLNGGGSPVTSAAKAGGSTNYRGFAMTLDYLLTNNLNLQQQWSQSITLDKNIGPFRRYKQYEIEFVYGF